ncbi:MAG: hypothetical protein WDM85_19500 [Caulobacteraceae bacterium]
MLSAMILDGSWLQQARAAQACAWIVESVEDGGAHHFELNLSADAPTSWRRGTKDPASHRPPWAGN